MAPKPTFKQKFQYWLDNNFSRGPLILISWLAVGTAFFVLIMTVISYIPGIRPEGQDLKQVFWNILFQALTPNPFDTTVDWQFLVVMLVVTLGSLFMVSILIGTLTSGIEAKVDQLREGRSIVLEEGHTVILGWSPQVFTIISELVIANANQKNPAIAILADQDKVAMESEIKARVPDLKNTRVVCRSGSPIDPADLTIVRPETARSIVVLPQGDMPDASVVKAVLALTRIHSQHAARYHIVTQVRNARTLDVLKLVGTQCRIIPLFTGDLISRVTAQTSRQSGLSVVYTELLDFEGDEIYFSDEPGLVEKTYGEALSAYEESSVIGIQMADGTVHLNPAMDVRFSAGDKVIAISEDDDTVKLSGLGKVPVDAAVIQMVRQSAPSKPERTLILGWNASAPVVVQELDHYVPPASEVLVVTGDDPEDIRTQCAGIANQRLEVRQGDTTDRHLLDKLDIASFNHVIVLADTRFSLQMTDARTMVTLLHLRDISLHDATPFSIVSEMLDLRNRELVDSARVDDFIVSDHLVSLLTTQLSENADLEAVFTDLFDADGSEIYLKPMSDYVQTGVPVNFYTVIEAARQRNETAIGYRLLRESDDESKNHGIHTNPKKSERVTFAEEDKIIVLAED
jgi:voltage-gated potassium channel Kch